MCGLDPASMYGMDPASMYDMDPVSMCIYADMAGGLHGM